MNDTQPLPRIAVSVAARHPETGSFLLVRRGRPPAKDLWAFPGGRLDYGETLADAALRELQEETGLSATGIVFHTLYELMSDGSDGDTPHHYVLAVHRATASGKPVAADDADDAGWFTVPEMQAIDITASTLAVAREIDAEYE